ncbi:hypothetical protein BAUCODRAFT_549107 [Baudoinia panamericana UAMH 10762]|uniref:Uncharacterized protein n=1 Tax=Baudoinia panamericana (strain UAMH 10762) TaxID=717646 RepID=M2N611_BAUPA|nr:uncharacterized protein BAUCODRAFT_549107 [Baudoinia panamericana UAMH 10762]EMC94469.1 hypothetical protein BAUCODRAFT_549107 [Baudoinia panamericana UAMH 10762]
MSTTSSYRPANRAYSTTGAGSNSDVYLPASSVYSSASSSSTSSRQSRLSSSGTYQPRSHAGSHIGMTNAGISDPRQRIGYVEDMPAPDWFSSGASRDPYERQKWAGARRVVDSGLFDGVATAERREGDGSVVSSSVSPFGPSTVASWEVGPEDSISQVSGQGGARGRGRRTKDL